MSLLKGSSNTTFESMTWSVLTRERQHLCCTAHPKAAQMNCKRKKKKEKMFSSSEEQLLWGAERDISFNDGKQLWEAENVPKLLKSSLVGDYLVTVTLPLVKPYSIVLSVAADFSGRFFSFLPWDQAVVFLVLGKCLAEPGNNSSVKPTLQNCSCASNLSVVLACPVRCPQVLLSRGEIPVSALSFS